MKTSTAAAKNVLDFPCLWVKKKKKKEFIAGWLALTPDPKAIIPEPLERKIFISEDHIYF